MAGFNNLARLQLQVGSLSLPVVSLAGEEALSEPFRFDLEVLAAPELALAALIAQPALARVSGRDGLSRRLAGVITALEEQGRHHDGRRRVRLRLESRLALLRCQRDQRMILNHNVVDLARELLLRHGFAPQQLRFQLTRDYPARPTTLQAGESDLAFLQRLLAGVGIFFWSSVEEEAEVLHFSDHNSHCPSLDLPPVRYTPRAGMDPALGAFGAASGIQRLEVRQRLVAAEFQVHDRSEGQPQLAIAGAARSAAPGAGTQVHFGTGALGPDQARSQAQLLAERAAVESFELCAQGDIATFAVGASFGLDAALLSPALSSDYLITRLRHRASQRAGLGVAGEDLAYSNVATLIRRETPYRPPQPPRLQLPMTFTARIEADGPTAQLDEQGRYRLRPHFERGDAAHGEASIPIRRLTPYGGPPGEQPTGLHLPLRDGAEVLLSCLNGDPDRPMIVGSVPNPQTASPVTSANPHQNRLRTAGDNELCLDDQIDHEAITLRTFAGHNLLQLNAAALGHQIRLASEQGAMQWQAKKTMQVQSGDTLTERSGGDRIHTVENRHQTVTNSGEIHYQAATDLRQSAGKSVRMQAGQNIEASSGQHLRIDVAEGKQLTVHGPQASFTVQDGSLQIQAAKEIEIRGDGGGDIRIGQEGGGLVIKADGSVNLYGSQITLKGGGVSFNGVVNYQLGGGAAMPKVPAAAPMVPTLIPALRSETAPAIYNPAWSRPYVPVGDAVEAMFSVKNFQGGETAIITIFETNADGSRREIDQLCCRLDDGFGQHRLPWRRSPEQVQDDLVNDETCGDQQPLTYVFEVEVDSIQSHTSPGLNLTTAICFTPLDSEDVPIAEGTELQLTDVLGRRHKSLVANGTIEFRDILVGPWQLQLGTDNILVEKES